MRHPLLFAAALVGMSVLAQPAAAQKTGAGPAPKAPAGKAAPAAVAPTPAPKLDVNTLAMAAALDAGTKARVAPHVAAMNTELSAIRPLMDGFSKSLPLARRDSLHAALKLHYDAFDKHWQEADKLIPAEKRNAFDAAVHQQMGARNRPVGNPHQNLPATHPKVDAQGNPVKK